MDTERVDQLSAELGHLFQRQMEVLKASTVRRLTPLEIQKHAKRRERICELCAELSRSKGLPGVAR
jgi:hypothetical protein